jgi:hypothetical protein
VPGASVSEPPAPAFRPRRDLAGPLWSHAAPASSRGATPLHNVCDARRLGGRGLSAVRGSLPFHHQSSEQDGAKTRLGEGRGRARAARAAGEGIGGAGISTNGSAGVGGKRLLASGALPLHPGGGFAPCTPGGGAAPAPRRGAAPAPRPREKGLGAPSLLAISHPGFVHDATRKAWPHAPWGAARTRGCLTACAPVAAQSCTHNDASIARGSAGSQRCTLVHKGRRCGALGSAGALAHLCIDGGHGAGRS